MVDLSVQDVATRLATSGRTIRRYLATGQLAGNRTADGWMVSTANLDQFMAKRSVSPSTNGHVVADMASSMTETCPPGRPPAARESRPGRPRRLPAGTGS